MSSSAPASRRPNILFLFTDDQRFDTLRALGCQDVITPNLDALVRRGTAFTEASIMGGTSPAVCMPSRAMLHSGRTLFHIEREGQEIPDAHVLMGEAFRSAGYATFGTGKWHNGTRAYARSFSDGAEIFFGGMDDHWNVPACSFDPSGRYEQRCNQTVDFRSQRVVTKIADHIRAGKHSTDLFADAAIDFLQRRPADRPFFAYVSFMAPHDPRTMPKQYLDMYDPTRIALPPNYLPEHPFDNGELRVRDELLAEFPRTPDEVRRHLAAYYAMITHADAAVGRIIKTLKDTGQHENTIIVFAGDNGLAVGRHGLMGKQSLYEHSVRVPLVFAGPGVPEGRCSGAFAYLIDVFPTLCDLAGLPVPESVEGRSLAPALRDTAEPVRPFLHYAYRGLQRAVKDRRWKLIEYVVEGARTTQLFDLQSDPWETRNLAGDAALAPEIERLRRELARWRDEMGDTREEGRAFWKGMGS